MVSQSPISHGNRPGGGASNTRRTNCLVYFAVMLLGMTANLIPNILWVELPVLANKVPESRSLSLYLLCIWLSGNISAVILLLIRRCSLNPTNQPAVAVYIALGLNLTGVILLVLFNDRTAFVNDQQHSIILLLVAFLSSHGACVAGVSILPYAARLRETYITAALLGESLSGLLPHTLAIAQGLTISPECVNTGIIFNRTHMTTRMRPGRYRVTTTPLPVIPATLRFDEMIFYYVIAGIVTASTVAYILLRNVPSAKYHDEAVSTEFMEDVESSPHSRPGVCWRTTNSAGGATGAEQTGAFVLDDGSIRYKGGVHSNSEASNKQPDPEKVRFLENDTQDHAARKYPFKKNSSAANSSPIIVVPRVRIRSTESEASSARIKHQETMPSFSLLMFIVMCACMVMHGPLSTIKAHACLPSGNMTFFVGTVASNALNVIICLCVSRLAYRANVTIVVSLTSLASILLTYFVALIAFSHESESRKNSLIFANFGELLMTLAWIVVVGLFFFARVAIAVICRRKSSNFIIWYAGMSQLGAALGSLCMLDDVSICRVYRTYQEMYCDQK